MGSEINFALKHKSGDFVPLTWNGGSSVVFALLVHRIGYEKPVALTTTCVKNCIIECNELIEDKNKSNEMYEFELKNIASYNNNVEDKLEATYSIVKDMEMINSEIEEIKNAKTLFMLFEQIMEDCHILDDNYSSDDYIYAAIDYDFWSDEDDM